MTNIVNTGNASVDALAEMSISGNVTPVNWYKTILRENGKPYLLAICVLSEIVYWYRPVEVRDEHSGMTIGCWWRPPWMERRWAALSWEPRPSGPAK